MAERKYRNAQMQTAYDISRAGHDVLYRPAGKAVSSGSRAYSTGWRGEPSRYPQTSLAHAYYMAGRDNARCTAATA